MGRNGQPTSVKVFEDETAKRKRTRSEHADEEEDELPDGRLNLGIEE
jgi:hypothetical protein